MTISTTELPQAILRTLYCQLTPYISGSPGLGKSDIIRDIAKELNLELIDIRLSQLDSTDLTGLPMLVNNRTTFVPPTIFPLTTDELVEGKQGWLIFLDELSSGSIPTQAAAYQLILDRQVGQYKLHPNVAIIAAGNKATDKAIVNRMSTAMQSRMVHFNLEVKHTDWLTWAIANNIDPRITSFIEFRPELLHKFDPNHQDNTYPAPRTWEFTNRLIKEMTEISLLDTKIISGTVGEGAAREFTAFCSIYNSLPKLKDILANPKTIAINKEPDVMYAFTGLISSNINSQTASTLVQFIERLPLEFQIVTWINSIKRNPELKKLELVKQWIKQHAKEVLM